MGPDWPNNYNNILLMPKKKKKETRNNKGQSATIMLLAMELLWFLWYSNRIVWVTLSKGPEILSYLLLLEQGLWDFISE